MTEAKLYHWMPFLTPTLFKINTAKSTDTISQEWILSRLLLLPYISEGKPVSFIGQQSRDYTALYHVMKERMSGSLIDDGCHYSWLVDLKLKLYLIKNVVAQTFMLRIDLLKSTVLFIGCLMKSLRLKLKE